MTDFRLYAEQWVHDEAEYEKQKTPTDTDDYRTVRTPEQWDHLIGDYLHRARVLGLENPAGRQAVAKAAVVAMGYLESVVRSYGALPEPGVPSGYNLDKIRQL
jgi:hypothetical protein